LLAEGGFAGVGDIEGFAQIARATGKCAEGSDVFGKEFGLLIKEIKGAVVVEMRDDGEQLVGGDCEGVLLDAIDFAGASVAFEGFGGGEASFQKLLLLEPVHVTAEFPGGNVAVGNAGMAGFFKVLDDHAVRVAGAEGFVDELSDFEREAGDFADARVGR